MPFSGPYSIFSALANWGTQQAPKVQNWWDDQTSDLQSFIRDDWRNPSNLIDPVFQSNTNNMDALNRLRDQMDWIEKRQNNPQLTGGTPFQTGFNPHQQMSHAQRPMFQYDKPQNPAPDYQDWGW